MVPTKISNPNKLNSFKKNLSYTLIIIIKDYITNEKKIRFMSFKYTTFMIHQLMCLNKVTNF